MATISQAALFNDLAYYITTDKNGNRSSVSEPQPICKFFPPAGKSTEAKPLPSGQMAVTFVDTYDKQAYIAIEEPPSW